MLQASAHKLKKYVPPLYYFKYINLMYLKHFKQWRIIRANLDSYHILFNRRMLFSLVVLIIDKMMN